MNVDEIKDAFLEAASCFGDETIGLELDVSCALILVSTIQLSCRHPGFNGPSRKISEKIARDIQARLGLIHPALSAGLELGWNWEHDVNAQGHPIHPTEMIVGTKCRVCGCTNDNACMEGGEPCHWVEPDLCSACAPAAQSIIRP